MQVKVVVFGASGVIGLAATRHFASLPDWEVVAVSRRRPDDLGGAGHLALDLTDATACASANADLRGITHIVYAALQESPGLVPGWRDRELMEHNLDMFRHALDAVHGSVNTLEHVSLLQGTKAYGVHVDPHVPVPARERSPRHPHDNFYFLQQDLLRERADRHGWSWTILRPQVVYGESLGSPMNLIPAIGAFAAVERQAGRALRFPGGPPRVSEAVDADLLARALAWAATATTARNEIFNIANGDVFVWHHLWPAIADALGMEAGPPEPCELATVMPARASEWAAVVDHHHLRAPRDLRAFTGDSFVYADRLFGYGTSTARLPALVSTIKIRQAGFADCVDSEEMFGRWFDRLQQRRLLPPR